MPVPFAALTHTMSSGIELAAGGQFSLAPEPLRRLHLVVLGGHDRVGQLVFPQPLEELTSSLVGPISPSTSTITIVSCSRSSR